MLPVLRIAGPHGGVTLQHAVEHILLQTCDAVLFCCSICIFSLVGLYGFLLYMVIQHIRLWTVLVHFTGRQLASSLEPGVLHTDTYRGRKKITEKSTLLGIMTGACVPSSSLTTHVQGIFTHSVTCAVLYLQGYCVLIP